ncbi:chitosanase [Anaerotardibacter muris]|uniref:chitosanase n=1 Tax=Anaerotardibacter muris TaxID=2941505 RepID=UPI00203CBA5C|nr:chitosanase [Anaerotardibacter muris]
MFVRVSRVGLACIIGALLCAVCWTASVPVAHASGDARVAASQTGQEPQTNSVAAAGEQARSAGSWVKASKGWWYRYADGTWPANTSLQIKGKTYRFDPKGWMVTGWSKVAGEWRFYARSGAMRIGWLKTGGKWYYLEPSSGKMLTGWQSVAGKRYYLSSSGAMKTGWLKADGAWYRLASSGALVMGWQKVGGKWYYLDPSNGKMLTGWQKVAGKWYYLDAKNGDMKTGWLKLGSDWYYLTKSGAMATNTTISGKYWVGADGKWTTKPTSATTGSSSAAGSTGSANIPQATLEANKLVGTIAQGTLRDTVFALVSSAENSTIDFNAEYGYIEDIGDGRGYTCGIIGFTSATGDLLDVVELYVKLAPANNPLQPYLPALRSAVGSSTHAGLGSGFVSAWKKACVTPQMKEAQNAILNGQYMLPAVKTAQSDGLSPLGQYIYYDALVMHGPGNDAESFGGIRAAALKKAKTPAQGGSEATYLGAFLDARSKVMLKEEAHSDLSRITVQRTFIKEGKWDLSRPLSWTMYGDRFELK